MSTFSLQDMFIRRAQHLESIAVLEIIELNIRDNKEKIIEDLADDPDVAKGGELELKCILKIIEDRKKMHEDEIERINNIQIMDMDSNEEEEADG